LKYNKRRGFFCKMVKRRRDSLLTRGKGRGLWAKCHVFFLPTRWETGEAAVGRRRRRFRRPGARGGSGVRGKGSGRPAGPIPGRSSGGVVPGRSGHEGGRRWAAVALGRRPRGAAVSKGRGKSITGPRGCPNLPRFGPRGSGEGSPAVAGGGKGERRRCKLEEEGWRWWRWQWGGGAALGALLKASQGGGGLAGRGRRPAGGAAELRATRRGGAGGEAAQQ